MRRSVWVDPQTAAALVILGTLGYAALVAFAVAAAGGAWP